VFFAGHGLAAQEGNILTPVDAKVNCAIRNPTQMSPLEERNSRAMRKWEELFAYTSTRWVVAGGG
jgi:hypothetical protein